MGVSTQRRRPCHGTERRKEQKRKRKDEKMEPKPRIGGGRGKESVVGKRGDQSERKGGGKGGKVETGKQGSFRRRG